MAPELAFALINPYTISKSRTGGVIGRLATRTGLEIVGARMYGPRQELVESFAELIEKSPSKDPKQRKLLGDYVRRSYGPDPRTGKRRRVLLLLFEGENAVSKIYGAAVKPTMDSDSGLTVRDTFGDCILDEKGEVTYFEPAVLVGPSVEETAASLRLWAEFSETDGGVVESATDVPTEGTVQKTLVLIKPDNFRFPSARPGNIIDIFSGSGLRIVCAKVQRMSVAEAEEFYGPVRQVLREKLTERAASFASKAVAKEMGLEIPEEVQGKLGSLLGPVFADQQFGNIVEFMTGWRPEQCPPEEKQKPGKQRCLALVYKGVDAVNRIRTILGPTDPSKAQPGSVRREFGQDIMVNAAHASDSPENAAREMRIIKVEQDRIKDWVDRYYPT